ncbi:MAG TPA: hypothetical protein PKV47_05145 [Bacteroidales bacterium]|nr:hypothetical protein [Bacteroidales bacterium]
MEKAGLIVQLRNETGGICGFGKVDKVYLAVEKSNAGNMCEAFFFNQMRIKNDVISSKKPML